MHSGRDDVEGQAHLELLFVTGWYFLKKATQVIILAIVSLRHKSDQSKGLKEADHLCPEIKPFDVTWRRF